MVGQSRDQITPFAEYIAMRKPPGVPNVLGTAWFVRERRHQTQSRYNVKIIRHGSKDALSAETAMSNTVTPGRNVSH